MLQTESLAASALNSIIRNLNLPQPSVDVTAKQLFALIGERLKETIPKAGMYLWGGVFFVFAATNPLIAKLRTKDRTRLGGPLFTPVQPLTDDQWQSVAEFHRSLDAEYDLRRDMLLTRLDVTVQSFQWSDKHPAAQRDAIGERYAQRRRPLDGWLHSSAATTGVPALLAARQDLAIVERTVSARMRTSAPGVQKHLMGGVPDRGGRSLELCAPPPEMPSWSKRNPDAGGGGGGGRGRVSYDEEQDI